MGPYRMLVLEIEKFDSWEQPWSFYEALSASPSLDVNAHEKLKSVWATAVERSSWLMSKAFADGCSHRRCSSEVRFSLAF